MDEKDTVRRSGGRLEHYETKTFTRPGHNSDLDVRVYRTSSGLFTASTNLPRGGRVFVLGQYSEPDTAADFARFLGVNGSQKPKLSGIKTAVKRLRKMRAEDARRAA